MNRRGSNHGSEGVVESWVEHGQVMSRTGSNHGSNHESNKVDRVEQGRIMSRTRSNHEAQKVAT